ncbi:MAG: ABC transporter ATP-binding protein [Hyphomicrobium sp.]
MAPVSDRISVRIDRKEFPALGAREANLVLQGLEIAIEPRSFVVLTGPSGCGKSTLLNIVAGLDQDFDGAIDLGLAVKRTTFIFQTPRLLPWRTVHENLLLSLPDGDPRVAGIAPLLERVGMTEAAGAYPERLSLGMQRRVALVRGFVQEPDLLLMDEPFVSLDDPTAQELRQVLIDLWHRVRATVLFVTHDRTEAVMLGTRILRLGSGSATVLQDAEIRLTREQRLAPAAVRAEVERVFGDT